MAIRTVTGALWGVGRKCLCYVYVMFEVLHTCSALTIQVLCCHLSQGSKPDAAGLAETPEISGEARPK